MLEVIYLPKAVMAVCPNGGGFHKTVVITYLWFANQMRELPGYRLVSTVIHEFGAPQVSHFMWYCPECLSNGMKNPPAKEGA
jgi:hypothetical protein